MELKELTKIMALCRKNGVDSIEIEGIKLVFNQNAPIQKHRKTQLKAVPDIESETPLSPEDILNWSSTSIPEGF